MSICKLSEAGVLVDVVPLSNKNDRSVHLVTIKKRKIQMSPMTCIFTDLPDTIRSHCIRTSVIAEFMARHTKNSEIENVIWLGSLYHHIYENIVHENLPYEGYEQNVSELILEIVSTCKERMDGSGYPNNLHGEGRHLAARLAGLADMWDEIAMQPGNMMENIKDADEYMAKNGERLFGFDAMDCFHAVRDEIIKLYSERLCKEKYFAG